MHKTPCQAARLVCLTLLAAGPTLGQGTTADYERAFSLRASLANKLTHDRLEPEWISPTSFWFKANLGSGETEKRLVDCRTGEVTPLTDASLLEAETLDPAERTGTKEPSPQTAKPSDRSPDQPWRLETRLGALYLCHKSSDEARRLAPAPDRDGSFSTEARWSADSKHVVVWENVPGDGRMVQLIESSPNGQLQPILHEQQYDKPGDALPWRRPRLFATESAEEVPIDLSELGDPWSIDRLRWLPDGSAFTLVFNQRGHQSVRVVKIDTAGKIHTVFDESSPTFVHYSGRSKCWLHRLDYARDGEDWVYRADAAPEALWTSERDGWNHLYRLDLSGEGEAKQLTRGPWVVRRIEHVDHENRQVWFYAGGVIGGQDPYYRHLCRVGFDGEGFVVLTEADGDHSVRWSPEGDYFLDTYSRVDLPPVTELRRASDGSLVGEIQRADASALVAAGWRAPERFVAKGRDGKTDIYGMICRPSNFDPEKKYPVVEEHYAGPHSAHCPKRFSLVHRSQEFCELGFIVVQLDGMGTDHRGKAFHDVCWQNLVDAGLPDRIAWIRALAEHEPAIDLERVGIRGTSAGGQTGMAALLHHGDFYKACVSNCGCHDNRTDKVWWNEQWMGYPIGPHYEEQSNVTQAHKLEGDLLLIVGEMDRNVPPTATLQVVDALIRADKDFEFLFVPGGGHGARHPVQGDYTNRQTWDFFVRKLMGVAPRAE